MNASTANTSARRDIAADITQKILAELSKGVMPWRKPWIASGGATLPLRVTGEPYRGANTILLWAAASAKGFASPYWLTFNQTLKLGASVRKGERGEIVVYYGRAARSKLNSETGKTEGQDEFRFLKAYVAFNADQIDNLPERFHAPLPKIDAIPIEAHEAWFAKLGIARIQTRDAAFYSPGRDVIGMPPISVFESPEAYAATLDHEICNIASVIGFRSVTSSPLRADWRCDLPAGSMTSEPSSLSDPSRDIGPSDRAPLSLGRQRLARFGVTAIDRLKRASFFCTASAHHVDCDNFRLL